jgi:hypothetical protein
MSHLYEKTLVPESPWKQLADSNAKENVMRMTWLLTWGCLLLGFTDPFFWWACVGISALQAAAVTALVGFEPLVFPAQLRIAYTLWVLFGTAVPYLRVMMHITSVGVFLMLGSDYCPLARMLYLFPWNRTHDLTPVLALKTFTQMPKPGRFCLTVPRN